MPSNCDITIPPTPHISPGVRLKASGRPIWTSVVPPALSRGPHWVEPSTPPRTDNLWQPPFLHVPPCHPLRRNANFLCSRVSSRAAVAVFLSPESGGRTGPSGMRPSQQVCLLLREEGSLPTLCSLDSARLSQISLLLIKGSVKITSPLLTFVLCPFQMYEWLSSYTHT